MATTTPMEKLACENHYNNHNNNNRIRKNWSVRLDSIRYDGWDYTLFSFCCIPPRRCKALDRHQCNGYYTFGHVKEQQQQQHTHSAHTNCNEYVAANNRIAYLLVIYESSTTAWVEWRACVCVCVFFLCRSMNCSQLLRKKNCRVHFI